GANDARGERHADQRDGDPVEREISPCRTDLAALHDPPPSTFWGASWQSMLKIRARSLVRAASKLQSQSCTALPFSGTRTLVPWPFISAMNLSADGSMIGNEP